MFLNPLSLIKYVTIGSLFFVDSPSVGGQEQGVKVEDLSLSMVNKFVPKRHNYNGFSIANQRYRNIKFLDVAVFSIRVLKRSQTNVKLFYDFLNRQFQLENKFVKGQFPFRTSVDIPLF